MFKTRLISGVILVVIALATIISGGKILFATLLIISLIGVSELYKIFDVHKKALGICGYAATVLYYFYLYEMTAQDTGTMGAGFFPSSITAFISEHVSEITIVMILMIAIMAVYVFSYPKYKANQVMAVFFGFFYFHLY